MIRSLICALVLIAPGAIAQTPAVPQRAVLVTGASSGIGRRITERLAASGFYVYAGARAPADIAALGKIKNVQAIRLDVTIPAEITAAVAAVKKGGRGLYGVVNNAGVIVVAPLIEMKEADLANIFAVNVYGPVRVTRAFAPLLIESRGRVVNISSLAGLATTPMLGAYAMTKHAVEAFGDGLAMELGPLGVRVSLIEPGNFGTELGSNVLARTDTTGLATSRFGDQMRMMLGAMRSYERNPPPDAVAEAALHAFTSANPRPRYLIVPSANQAGQAIGALMDQLAQLNSTQPFSFPRATLVQMLDDALARAKR